PISYSYLISEIPSYENPGGSTFIGDPTSSHDAVIFIPGNTRVKVIFFGSEDAPLGILTNMEKGISVETGRYLDLSLTALHFAKDLLFITEERIVNLRKERVLIGLKTAAEESCEKAKSLLLEAEYALMNNKYPEYYAKILMAWYYARNAYVETKKSIVDSTVTVIFFFVLTIPASLSLERLIFHKEGRSRIILLVLIFAMFTFILYMLHPGFRLASNSGMVALGFTTLVLIVPVPIIMFKDTFDILKEIREKIIGAHFIDVARIGIVFKTFSIGIENLRKNAFRSSLTFFSIILVTLSLTAFTSVSPIWVMIKSPPPMQTAKQWEPRYDGILITRTEINAPINPNLANLLKALYGEKIVVAPRAFLPSRNTYLYNASTGAFRVSGILGFSPEETEVLRLQEAVLPGALIPWFVGDNLRSCYVSKDVAQFLKIKPGDKVFLYGIELKVLGIIDQGILESIYDIDGQQITPLDPDKYIPPIPRVFWGLIFIPYDLSISIGAITTSIAIKFQNKTMINEVAQDLSNYLSYYVHYVYVSQDGKSYLYTPRVLFNVAGWEFASIPFILTALLLTNIMLGAFHERAKHILIYSTLGAAPSHVAFIFLSESIIYSLLGATIGYLAGLTIGTLVGGLVPGISANYTSIQIILAVALCIAAVISGSIYPLFRASRAVTPSFERAWKIPTKPKGLEWEISLPYSFEEPEAKGVIAYIREFAKSYSSEATSFIVSEMKLSEEMEMERKIFKLDLMVRLRPYERGVVEQVVIIARPLEENKYCFNIHAKLLAGPRQIWLRGHRGVIDTFRKQILLWRALSSEERRKYMDIRWD
ncbi:MAG: FtsX-like permease family protein, partial [Candidatus Bathyarchaeia archaeon]